jgi:hypothetical protein
MHLKSIHIDEETLHPHLDWFGDTASSEADKEKNGSPAILVIENVVCLCVSASFYSYLVAVYEFALHASCIVIFTLHNRDHLLLTFHQIQNINTHN